MLHVFALSLVTAALRKLSVDGGDDLVTPTPSAEESLGSTESLPTGVGLKGARRLVAVTLAACSWVGGGSAFIQQVQGAAPSVQTSRPTGVSETEARLNAIVTSDLPSATQSFEWGPGSMALQFDGRDDSIAFSRGVVPGSGDFTVEAWAQIDAAASGNYMIFAQGQPGANVFLGPVDGLIWAGESWPNTGVPFPFGGWHHFALVKSVSDTVLYIDGVQAARRGGPISNPSDTPFFIGKQYLNYPQNWRGGLGEVRVWDVALSESEVAAQMNAKIAPTHPKFNRLLGYWPLDQDQGKVVYDASGKGNAGTLVGRPGYIPGYRPLLTNQTPARALPAASSALALDGVDDYVDVPDATWFSGDLTVEAWVYPRAQNRWPRVIDFGNGETQNNVVLTTSADGQGLASFVVFDAQGRSSGLQSPAPLPLNQWSHLAVTLQGTNATMFLNGVPWATGASFVPPNIRRTNNFIGRSNWSGDSYENGLINDVRIWNRALDGLTLRAWMHQPATAAHPNSANLQANWRFDENSGTSALDSGPNAQHATLVNGPVRLPTASVAANLSGLTPGLTYHYRATASNTAGRVVGPTVSFFTPKPGSGGAIYFNEVRDLVRIPGVGQRLPTSEVTVEFWQFTRNAAEQSSFGLESDFTANRFQAHLPWRDQTLYWDFGDFSNQGRISQTMPPDMLGSWQHVALVSSRANNSMKIYRNGVVIAEKLGASTFNPYAANLLLGSILTGGNAYPLSGALDEFRIWSTARSEADIRANLNVRLAGNESGLLACYRADGVAGLVTDAAGGTEGMLVGGAKLAPSSAPLGLPMISITGTEQSTAGVTLNARVKGDGISPTRLWIEYGTNASPIPGSSENVVSFYNLGYSLSSMAQVNFSQPPTFVQRFDTINLDAGVGAFWPGGPGDYLAARYEGRIFLPESGVYTFGTSSDDGSLLYVDGQLVVNSDGLHGATLRVGTATLTAGYHQLDVRMFENGGAASLIAYYAGPGVPLQVIPATAFLRFDPSYSSRTSTQTVPASASVQAVSLLLDELPLGTVHYRLVAANDNGTNIITDQVFETERPSSLSSLTFNGQNQFVRIPIALPLTEATHEFWFRTSEPSGGLLEAQDDSAGFGGSAFANNWDRAIWLENGNLGAYLYNKEYIGTGNLNLADSRWHHVAHVFGASVGGQRLYVDGALVAQGSKTASDFTWQTRLVLGYALPTSRNYFVGQMDEVRIWNRARTQDEILATMVDRLSGDESGLIAYYRLDGQGDNSTDVLDSSAVAGGQKHPGTRVNGPAYLSLGAPLTRPLVTTQPPIPVLARTATLRGIVNPNAQEWLAAFEYGATPSLGKVTSPPQRIRPMISDQLVEAGLADLDPGATYYYRAVAYDKDGTPKYGSILQFTTLTLGCGWPISSKATDGDVDSPYHITDSQGNLYVIGQFSGSATFKTTLRAEGGATTNAFLAKISRGGDWVWNINLPVSIAGSFKSLALDPAGNVVVVGQFTGTATFGTNDLNSGAGSQLFVAKFSSTGDRWLWAKALGGTGVNSANAVAVNPSGSIYVAGQYSGSVTAGSTVLNSVGGADVMIAKLDAQGNWVWARSAGGGGSGDVANALVLDSTEGVYVTGQFSGAGAGFGSFSLSAAGGDDLFLAKLTSQGVWVFARRAGGVQADTGTALAVDSADRVFLGGRFGGTADFSPESNLNLGDVPRFFVARLDSRSGGVAGFVLGGEGQLTALTADRNGKVFAVGDFSLSTQLGNLPQVFSAGNRDVFVAQLDATTLSWDWAQGIGASGLELGGSVSMDPAGSLTVSGTYRGTLQLGQVVLTTANRQEVFLARLDLSASKPRFEHNTWVIGQPIAVPADAQDPSRSDGGTYRLPQIAIYEKDHPDTDANNAFAWSEAEHKLYAVRPVTALIRWPLSAEVTNLTLVAACAGRSVWPASPQIHVATVPAEVQGPLVGVGLEFRNVEFSENGGTVVPVNRGIDQFQVFNASRPGYSVVKLVRRDGSLVFEVVRTKTLAELETHDVAEVGSTLRRPSHTDPTGKNGYVYYENSLYDGAGQDRAHDRTTRSGPIIPVNAVSGLANDLVVVWYHTNAVTGIAWPDDPVHYLTRWPSNAAQLVLASGLGSGPLDPGLFPGKRVYSQPDRALPGYNPNEEHAALYTDVLYALRNDLNARVTPRASEPYVLLKYRSPSSGDWTMKAYQVVTTNEVFQFRFAGEAGKELYLPAPLSLLPLCGSSNQAISGPWFKDYIGRLYARAAGPRGGTAEIVSRYWYPLQPDFFYDLNGDGQPEAPLGAYLGWLEYRTGAQTPPVNLTYRITWPTDVPSLQIGETLTAAKAGLPDVRFLAQAKVIYDDGNLTDGDPTTSLVRLFDPLSERTIQLKPEFVLSPRIATAQAQGRLIFTDLPFAIRTRLRYDPLNRRLSFGGFYDDSGVGEPLLLINVISQRERARILQLNTDGNADFQAAIDQLFNLTRNPNQVDLDRDGRPDAALRLGLITQILDGFNETLIGPVSLGITTNAVTNLLVSPVAARVTNIVHEPQGDRFKALTAGSGGGSGYVTLVQNNDPKLNQPVGLLIVKVGDGPFAGDLKAIYSDNLFDEKLTLRHSADFGGNPDALEFEWYYKPDGKDASGNTVDPKVFPTVRADGSISDFKSWTRYPGVLPGTNGVNDVTLGDGSLSKLLTLADNWFICRYRGYDVNGTNQWSDWVGAPGRGADRRAMLAEGWIKRVVRGLNPFDSRTKDFHSSPVNTYASMLQQAGQRYEGDIALNADPDAINRVGLIEAYTTVLKRGRNLSIDSVPPVNFDPANNALLLASSKISDLYMLLGNEAYADAQDPTIGFGTSSGEYGTTASSIFAFQNQLDSLLEEELALLRGRDNGGASVSAQPIYNRLFWNFTLGEGEVGYRQTYNITDVNRDGFLDEKDARVMYPQGHGDAWGHYLTSITTYYDLLQHPNFTWIPRTESVLVAGAPVEVDFLDERKFARVAAAKAKAGAEIVNLTYRQKYVDDTAGQWQGYKDTDPDRAWGVTEWARRAGQGAIFDWVTANAVLFTTDPNPNHTGIEKIDRQTVLELGEIPAQLAEIQKQLDQGDVGLNPIGLVKGAVPFDIDPTFLQVGSTAQIGRRAVQGLTQFDQILERAISALNNAVKVWNQANKATELLRGNQDSVEEFTQNTIDQERDYKNRLIEIFGYPYAGDIGAGQTYPSGYDGPDTYHWMYVNTREITGDTAPPSQSFTGFFKPMPNGLNRFTHFPGSERSFLDLDTTNLASTTLQVNYPRSAATYAFVAPLSWGQRRAPGKIQEALSDVVQNEARLKQALKNYDALIANITSGLDLLDAQFGVNAREIQILEAQRGTITAMNAAIGVMKATQIVAHRAARVALSTTEIMGDAIPKIVGLAFDVGSPISAGIETIGLVIGIASEVAADAAEIAGNSVELAKEGVNLSTEIDLRVNSQNFEILQRVKEIESMIRDEAFNRLEVFTQREMLNQSVGRYQAALAEGQRLLQEVVVFRQRAASQTSISRYQDMTFRIFRNDALQKYRATFDLAARYVYLAANAYDYEVNFNPGDPRAGRDFLTDIIRQRSLGEIVDGSPAVGQPGLADPLARLEANWAVLKTQFGVINPQIVDTRFSLRKEFFRIKEDEDSNGAWREALMRSRVGNLWDLPEFRRFCRPFAPESAGPQPGLVIRFPTTITFGLNYFGWPLAGGDNNYDPAQFATKISGAAVWLSGSDGTQVSQTPRVYLVPVGLDVMRSPSGDTLRTREWRIVDQALPAPFPIGPSSISDPNWIPQFASLGGTFADIRRYGAMIAKHDQGIYQEVDLLNDTRLIGRSAWNSDWMLIIPGGTLLNDPNAGLEAFIDTVSDVKIYFQTYSYSGN
jgi:hypothetical protein